MDFINHWYIFGIFAAISAALTYIWRRGAVRRVLAYARARKWQPLIVDAYSPLMTNENDHASYFRLRYRTEGGKLRECVLRTAFPADFTIERELAVADDDARAMYDNTLATDCFKCGHTIARGQEQCPYCRRWRHELRIT